MHGRGAAAHDPRASNDGRSDRGGGARDAWRRHPHVEKSQCRRSPMADVVMPQMGESIAEGTIVRWIKKVGDAVERDEPLFEISTDKVDAEIPSPAAGIVSEIRAREGETVPVNSVVA